MADVAPQLSPAFDANVMASVRPRRLDRVGRAVMGAYSSPRCAMVAWTMWEVGVTLMAASTVVGAGVAVGLSTCGALTLRSA